MKEFHCLALSPDGRQGWRRLEAPDERACIAQLVGEGFTPLRLTDRRPGIIARLNEPVTLGGGVGRSDMALLFTQLAMLVSSGLPVDRSLDLLADQSEKAGQRRLLSAVLARVRGGQSLGKAMEEEAKFPAWATGILRSSEHGGKIGRALSSIAERMNTEADLRAKLISALTYPAAVLLASLAALIIVVTTVIPQFEPIFEGEEANLPALTRTVLAVSRLVRENSPVLGAGGAIVILVGVWLVRSQTGRSIFSRMRSRFPFSGLRDQYLAASFSGLLGVLSGNGVTLVKAIPLVRRAMPSLQWQADLLLVEQRLREGRQLSEALKESSVFPGSAARLIEVGEKTGNLAETCARAGAIMAAAASSKMERIVSLANPIAIIGLGAVVALLVAGVILGIFSLGNIAV